MENMDERYQKINDEFLDIRKQLVENIVRNILLKKEKFELEYHEKPKYVVLPRKCLSLLNLYSDKVIYHIESIELCGMTIIESKCCNDFTDIFVL